MVKVAEKTLPIDNEDGLKITLSVMRGGTGFDISHYLEDKHIQNEKQLKNIVIKASVMLWESNDIKNV